MGQAAHQRTMKSTRPQRPSVGSPGRSSGTKRQAKLDGFEGWCTSQLENAVDLVRTRPGWAKLTWYSELLCMFLTVVYSGMVLFDIYFANGPFFSSKTWYETGFCVWKHEKSLNQALSPIGLGGGYTEEYLTEFAEITGMISLDSHSLSFIVDLLICIPLMLLTGRYLVQLYRGELSSEYERPLWLCFGSAFGGFGHGFAHLLIHTHPEILISEPGDFLSLAWAALVLRTFAGFGFAPVMGWALGCPGWVAVGVHTLVSALFIYIPPTFSFGAVQLVINSWYCVPRLIYTGYGGVYEPDHLGTWERTTGGMDAASIGITLIMPVVFAEMLGCDSFFRGILGHFLFDFSTMLLGIAVYIVISRAIQGKPALLWEFTEDCIPKSPSYKAAKSMARASPSGMKTVKSPASTGKSRARGSGRNKTPGK